MKRPSAPSLPPTTMASPLDPHEPLEAPAGMHEDPPEPAGRRHTVAAWIDRVTTVMAWIAGALMILVMLAISYSVMMRYLFNNPVPSVIEISSYLLLYITFLGAPWLLRQNGHVKVDLIIDRLGPRRRRVVDAANSLLGLAVSFVLFAQGTMTTIQQYLRGTTVMNILEIPKYLLIIVIPLGSLFLVWEFGRRFLSALQRGGR